MNCFSISVNISNHTPHDNYTIFGIYLTPVPVITVLNFMLILFHEQHFLVNNAVFSVLLQISSFFNYVEYDLLPTHLPRSLQFSRLSQPSSTSALIAYFLLSIVLFGCRLIENSLFCLLQTRHLVVFRFYYFQFTIGRLLAWCGLVTWLTRAFSTIYISQLLGYWLISQHSSFYYTMYLLVSEFTGLFLVLVLLFDLSCASLLVCNCLSACAVIISVSVCFHGVFSGSHVSARFVFSIIWRLFWPWHSRCRLWSWHCCSVCLAYLCASSYVLCNLLNELKFTRYFFLTYTSYTAFDTIISFSLQSTIYVNYSRPTPLSTKYWASSLLCSFSFGTESSCPIGRTTSSSFTLVNSVLRLFGIKSSSSFIRRKKTGNKRKTAIKEVARDGNYKPFM